VAEAVGLQVEQHAAFGERAALRDRRIERIAGRRRQHDVGRLLHLRPVLAGGEHAQELGMFGLAAHEGMHAAGELREALEIAGLLQHRPRHAGGKMDALRLVGCAERRDEAEEALDDVLEIARAAIEAVDAGLGEHAGAEELVEEFLRARLPGGGSRVLRNGVHVSSPGSCRSG